MSAWLAHLSWQDVSLIAFGFLSGFSAGAWWPRPVHRSPEYPVCSPQVSRAYIRALQQSSQPKENS